jgi:small subunit ribosomal protein S4e
VTTLREAKSVIYDGKINVDGTTRKSLHHSIGLMDVITLEGTTDIYRLVPENGHLLKPLKIDNSEKSKKLVKVTSKVMIKGEKIQLGFHDGRSIISDAEVNVNDSCLIQIPEQKILEVIKLEKNSQVIIIKGVNAGRIGHIDKIKDGTFSLPKKVDLTMDDRKIEIPVSLVMVIGKEKPVIKIR